MRSVQQGLKEEGFAVPMTKLCRWFEVARRTTYYNKPTRAPAKVKAELAAPIKEMIEAEPSFGYAAWFQADTVAGLGRLSLGSAARSTPTALSTAQPAPSRTGISRAVCACVSLVVRRRQRSVAWGGQTLKSRFAV